MMETRNSSIVVRSVRSEFVRIVGLTEDQRHKLASRIRELRSSNESGISIVVQYGLHGWLEVRDGRFSYIHDERLKITNALKEHIARIVKTIL